MSSPDYSKGVAYVRGQYVLTVCRSTPVDAGRLLTISLMTYRLWTSEFVSIEMLSEVRNGVPDAQDTWQGAFENYTFADKVGSGHGDSLSG